VDTFVCFEKESTIYALERGFFAHITEKITDKMANFRKTKTCGNTCLPTTLLSQEKRFFSAVFPGLSAIIPDKPLFYSSTIPVF